MDNFLFILALTMGLVFATSLSTEGPIEIMDTTTGEWHEQR